MNNQTIISEGERLSSPTRTQDNDNTTEATRVLGAAPLFASYFGRFGEDDFFKVLKFFNVGPIEDDLATGRAVLDAWYVCGKIGSPEIINPRIDQQTFERLEYHVTNWDSHLK